MLAQKAYFDMNYENLYALKDRIRDDVKQGFVGKISDDEFSEIFELAQLSWEIGRKINRYERNVLKNLSFKHMVTLLQRTRETGVSQFTGKEFRDNYLQHGGKYKSNNLYLLCCRSESPFIPLIYVKNSKFHSMYGLTSVYAVDPLYCLISSRIEYLRQCAFTAGAYRPDSLKDHEYKMESAEFRKSEWTGEYLHKEYERLTGLKYPSKFDIWKI